MTEVFPFARHGNFTQIDNAIFDVVMPELTPHEWMVLSFILRKTLGWQKDIDGIAYSQFIKGTSVKSNTTIQKSLAKLNSMGIIEVLESKHKADPHHYRLNKNYSCRVTGNVTQPITLNVIRPVTGNVDTKESFKESKKQLKESSGDDGFSEVVDAYQNNIATISPMVSKHIEYALDEFPKQYLLDAIEIAVTANQRSWRYINGILKKWRENGRQDIPNKRASAEIFGANGSLQI